jgi:hypothetical protein
MGDVTETDGGDSATPPFFLVISGLAIAASK